MLHYRNLNRSKIQRTLRRNNEIMKRNYRNETVVDFFKEHNRASKKYSTGLLMTQQFRFCGNSFRADTYMGCTFGCSYCFVNCRNFSNNKDFTNIRLLDLNDVKNQYDSINKPKIESSIFKALNQEMLQHRVPIHLGGMSDPFQICEFEYENTYKFLEIFRDYPLIISTKTNHLPSKYFDILNPKNKVFQISLFTKNETTLRIFENNTPSAEQRINFIKELKNKGYWVGLRIQPLIHLNETIELIDYIKDYVDFITVEHLKIPLSQKYEDRMKFMSKLGIDAAEYKPRHGHLKKPYTLLLNDIKEIKKVYNGKLGVGDNEILTETTGLNCCGLDYMPDAFNNWIKYNYLTIAKTNSKEHWYPKSRINTGIVSTGKFLKHDKNDTIKVYVDEYCRDIYKLDERGLF